MRRNQLATMRLRDGLCGAILLLATAWIARGDQLLARFVPPNVGLCLAGDAVPARLRAFLSGPLGERFSHHPAVQHWHAAGKAELNQARADLEKHFGLPLAELCDGVAGKEVLLGVWPDTRPGAGDGPAVLLVRAGNAGTLRRAVDALCDVQRQSGQLEPDQIAVIDGRTHTLRVMRPGDGAPHLYLTVVGDVGVLSNNRTLVDDVLQRIGAAGSNRGSTTLDCLADSASYRAAMAALQAKPALLLFINPRAWDRLIEQSLTSDVADDAKSNHGPSADDSDRARALWQSTEFIVGAVHLSTELRIEGHWHASPTSLPAEVREFSDAIAGRAGFLESIPADALVAVAGRAQWGRLARMMWSELAGDAVAKGENRIGAVVSADVLVQLLERLGPDCGAFVRAAPTKTPDRLPLDLAFGVEMRTRLPQELANTAAETVDQSLRSGLALATVIYNHEHAGAKAGLHTERLGDVALTSVIGIRELGEDLQPTYAMAGDRLLVGASRDVVAQAAMIDPQRSLAHSQRLARTLGTGWQDASQILYLDLSGLRTLIAEHDGFANHLAKKDGLTIDESKRRLGELRALLGLADTVVAACRVEPDSLSAVLSLTVEATAAER